MFGPRYSLIYVLRSWAKVWPFIGIIVFSVFAVTIAAAIANSLWVDISVPANFYQRYSLFTFPALEGSQQEYETIKAQFESSPNIEKVYQVTNDDITMQAIIGNSYHRMFFMDRSDQKSILRDNRMYLKEGRLPETTKEFVATQSIVTNRNLTIGEKYGKDPSLWEPWLKYDEYTLVGILDFEDLPREQQFQLGMALPESGMKPYTFVLEPKSGRETQLEEELQRTRDQFVTATYNTSKLFQKVVDSNAENVTFLVNLITIAVAISVTLSSGLLAVIIFNGRQEEIGLMLAIGHSRLKVITKILTELVIMVLMGLILGLVVTSITYEVLNRVFFDPKAIIGLSLWNVRTLTTSLPVPLVILVFTGVVAVNRLVRLDPVAILERK